MSHMLRRASRGTRFALRHGNEDVFKTGAFDAQRSERKLLSLGQNEDILGQRIRIIGVKAPLVAHLFRPVHQAATFNSRHVSGLIERDLNGLGLFERLL